MGNIGFPELVVIGVIALVIFGPGRLPELGKSLGRGIRDFKAALAGESAEETKPAVRSGAKRSAKT